MSLPHFAPRESGVSIVFDVPAAEVRAVGGRVAAAGFEVQEYYRGPQIQRPGGAAPGMVRLRAQRPLADFSGAEQDRAVADFDALGVDCERVGTDVWTAG